MKIAESTYCDHCGNQTFKKEIGSYFTSDETGVFETYSLYQCSICNGATLEKARHRIPEGQVLDRRAGSPMSPTPIGETEQLWPPPLSLPAEAPARVRQIYEEARSVMKRSPSSFVVQIGRALEAVTKDRNAEGRTLNDKLNWLIKEGRLPQVFGEMGHISRIFRNWGAHDAENDIEPGDVKIVDEFFKAIIEYIYVAPAKTERVQSLIQQRLR
jgi:hypothetical protein